MTTMLKRMGVATLAVLSLTGVAVAPARAGDGGAVAAGVIGGLAAGALVGSAAANANRGYYNGGYGYAPAYAPPPGPCYFTREPVYDDYGYVVGHRRVRVCD